MEGSLELLNHAIGHIELESGFDNRIAMISIDAAVENMIKSYLNMSPSLRGTKHISRDEYEKITKSFHSLLNGLVEHVPNKKLLRDDIHEIEWYHNIRNQLYHSGIDITVDKTKVETYLEIAKNLFSNLFDVRIDNYIETRPSTAIGEFFLTWREIMPQLERLADVMDLRYVVHDRRYMTLPRLVSRKIVSQSFYDELKEIRTFRHEITHGQKQITQKEIKQKITQLNKVLKELKEVEQGIISGKIPWKIRRK